MKRRMFLGLAAAAVIGIAGVLVADVGTMQADARPPTTAPPSAGVPAVSKSGAALPGDLLIADRDNNRILIVTPDKRIVWSYPRPGDLAAGERFIGPDDAFLTPGGRTIITNEEDHATIIEIGVDSHKVVWRYGRFDHPGYGAGLVNEPDDAYRLPNGWTTVAGINNCIIDLIAPDGHPAARYGTPAHCAHNPPYQLDEPNGDTPLPDGGMLVSEIRGHYIDRIDAGGRLVWSLQVPGKYPSDPQLTQNGNVLYVTYTNPGAVYEITPSGRVVWSYHPTSGPGRLDKPSLAIELPNGDIALNDDANQRVIIIDPATNRIVWQYGVTGVSGSQAGYLDNPDGIQLVSATPSPAPPQIVAYFSVPETGDIAVVRATDRTLAGLAQPTAIHVGGRPEREALSPSGADLVVMDAAAPRLIVVNTAQHAIARVLHLPGVAHDLVFSADGKRLYVTVPAQATVVAFDTAGWREIKLQRLPVGLAHIALSPDGRSLWGTVNGSYTAGAPRLLQLDLATGNEHLVDAGGNAHHLEFVPAVHGYQLWVDYNGPDGGLDRRLGRIDVRGGDTLHVDTLPQGAYPGHFAESPVAAGTGLVWLPGRGAHPTLWGVDPSTGAAAARIPLASPTLHASISPFGLLFAADTTSAAQVVDLQKRRVVATLPVSHAFDVVIGVTPHAR